MNEHTLKVLEYDKIRDIAAHYAASEPGRSAAANIMPAVDADAVETRLRETGEFAGIVQGGENPPFDGFKDIVGPVERLRVAGIMLAPSELLDMAATLGAGRKIRSFFQRLEGWGAAGRPSAPLLCARAAEIRPLKPIEDAIRAALDDNGEVRDSASPALRRIRKQINRTRKDILDSMSGILQNGAYQKVIQEPVVTVRDGRYVLPLKPNFRQSLQGVVHGQSGSRATLFVEPLDVLEQNNRLAELRMEEREEVERILRDLTSFAASETDAIETTFKTLTALDTVYARARFGMEYDATVPSISRDGRIRLRRARHPLLLWKHKEARSGSDVTPNDIELGGNDRVLIISGPNAGGKTALLKTVGLLCLMAQSGLPVTAAEGSELPLFGGMFADIGDEQSLEQSLSTFSSHIGQIAGILREARKDSLVLLDELGSGTDPAEGAALGQAVLEKLLAIGCATVVTTHHSALKLFGSQTSGSKNAAMEFDPETLEPTYRFIPGRPGRSYGLDMAARLGVPDEVIQKARSRLSDDEVRLGGLLERIEQDSRLLTGQREEAEQELVAARKDREEAAKALRAAKEETRTMKLKAREEAGEVLSALRRKFRDLSLASALEKAEVKKASTEAEAFAAMLEPEESEPGPASAQPGAMFHAGDRVRISRLNKTGTILTSRRDMLEIDIDGKKLRLPAGEAVLLETARPGQPGGAAPGWGAELQEQEGQPDRLNILGRRVPEALAEVDRAIDRASLSGLSSVVIIHGIGTGALKTAVTEFLTSHPLVAAIRPGKPAEGGAGVTVAELKK